MFVRVLSDLEIYHEHQVTGEALEDDATTCSTVSSDDEADEAGGAETFATAGRAGHADAAVKATISEADLREMLQKLRHRHLPELSQALEIAERIQQDLLHNCSTLVRLPAPMGPEGRLVVVGDLHGHLNDLLHLIDIYGQPGDRNMYIFNGDFVDKGVWGPEVLFFIFCLRLLHPKSVWLNRGNHESEICTEKYGFKVQLRHAYPKHGDELYVRIHAAFNQLPLAYVVGEKVCVIHGGLPLHPLTLDDIAAIRRGPVPKRIRHDADRTFQALLWSDPGEESGRSRRGMGCYFAPEVTKAFLETNNLQVLLRSHECVEQGYKILHSGLVSTVFSASNYDATNDACVAVVTSDLQVQPGTSWNEAYIRRTNKSIADAREELQSALTEDSPDNADTSILRIRLGVPSRWVCSPRHRALVELRRMVFLSRPELLQAFQQADQVETECSKGEFGHITVGTWENIMKVCLDTPPGFPWKDLAPYICTFNFDGAVRYVDSLLRFHCRFTKWLSDQWSTFCLEIVADKLHGVLEKEIAALVNSRQGVLEAGTLLAFFQRHLPKQAMQSDHIVELVARLDTARLGYISPDSLRDALKQRTSHCPAGHALRLEQVRGVCKCDFCRELVPTTAEHMRCEGCDYDICSACTAQADEARKGRVKDSDARMKQMLAAYDADMTAVRGICQSRCDVRALFYFADSDSNGYVDRVDFVRVVAELLQGNDLLADRLFSQVCTYADTTARWRSRSRTKSCGEEGALPVEKFVDCLAIVDLEECEEPTSFQCVRSKTVCS
eukprot:TRINITY_DN16569_c0_g2_i1.p1 TRINITY_DN16569_c0_g2~~TRINITY_DN16569_c0_g2_i1.p1  ORF type:complete len:782 (-),score=139.54 TRINITY_DN16569_c0_g2_i1:67-2412(-)